MSMESDRVEVEIEFLEVEKEMPAIELVDFLQAMDTTYSTLAENEALISDLSPSQMNEELFHDDEAKDTLLGRLHRYGALNDIKFTYRIHGLPQRKVDDEYEGLKIKEIQKESPLLISLTGGGVLIMILWLLAGVELEYVEETEVDKQGDTNKEITKKFKFNATSTAELLGKIKQVFE